MSGRGGQGSEAGATLQAFHTHLAAANPGVELPGFQCFRYWLLPELLPLLHCRQPETVFVGKVVAGASGTTALDERSGAKILQAGAGGDQGLAPSLGAGGGVLQQTGSLVSWCGRGGGLAAPRGMCAPFLSSPPSRARPQLLASMPEAVF